ncbi:acetyl-CoA carboxylase biotin carboxylase subunit family protein [Amycolatopsis sp. lyj-112]|uniref:ATP-grasp domain-containing protein n=1 Tax=Amycolatopsis sp. lyj-112 TaxID=2789288 RepID=UPI00397CB2D8
MVSDPARVDDVVSGLLRESVDAREFDIVCSEYETCIVPAAVLAEAFGLAGIPITTAVALRDKMVQKNLVRSAGIPVAECRTVVSATDLAIADGDSPFVVKPLAGSCSQLTYSVRDGESLERAKSAIASSGQHGPWLVEEFMAGDELHFDGVVRHGEVRFLGISRYLQNVIDIRNGGLVGSVTVDPTTSASLYEQALELTTGSLEALGHTDGVFHLEVFEHEGRLAFSECAGRIGGGMVYETTQAKFGVDLYDEWARAVLGLPSAISAGRSDTSPYGWVQLIAHPGRVTSMPDSDDLRAYRGVVAVQGNLRVGDTVPDVSAASHLRAARVVMRGEDENGLADDMRGLAAWFSDQVKVAS